MPSFTALGELSPNIVAALLGAAATLVAAVINLRIAWRREVLDRAQRARTSSRARRGLAIAISILVAAAGIGGYAGAMYVMQRDQQHTREVRSDLQQRVAEIRETAARFEQTRLAERMAIEAETRLLDARRRGAEGVLAEASLGPCRARAASGDAAEPPACTENEALGARLCAWVPAGAQVYEVQPFARWQGDSADWRERRASFGARLGMAEVGAAPAEDGTAAPMPRPVCVAFATWDSARALQTRLQVRYTPAEELAPARSASPAALPAAQAAVKDSD